MSCIDLIPETIQRLQHASTTVRYAWFTEWRPAIGVDKAKVVIKVRATAGAQTLSVQPAIQVAAVRTNNPDAATTFGSAQSGAGELVTANEDISGTTVGKSFVRFGVAYKAEANGEAQADVSVTICLETYGKIVATKTLQLIAPGVFDTAGPYYAPISGWLPSPMVSKIAAAFVNTNVTGTFKVGLVYQLANTSVENPGSWSAVVGGLFGSGEAHTASEYAVTYSATPEMWVRLGIKYLNDSSGANNQGVVTVSVAIRK